MEEICDEIMDLQRKGIYDLLYQKAQQLEGRNTKIVRTFGKDNQGNIAIDHQRVLNI
jgi:hypothetical protein